MTYNKIENNSKILIVEDELIIALDIQQILENFGYKNVKIAVDSVQLFSIIETFSPNIILMDIKLKDGESGIDLAVKLKSILDAPLIFLTSYSDEETLNKAKLVEPYGYLIKPFNNRELYTAIETAIYKHRMERKLRESEEKYRLLTENVNDIIWTTNLEGNLTYISASCFKILGYKPEELISEGLSILLSEVEYSNVLKFLTDNLAELKRTNTFPVKEYIIEHICKDGSKIIMELRINGLYDDAKVCYGISGISRDVTERYKTQEIINKLAVSFSSLHEEELFDRISEHLCDSLKIDVAYVGEYIEAKNKVKILGGSWDAKPVEKMEYDLYGSPCQTVIGDDVKIYKENVSKLFPEDAILAEESIESYCGIPLFNKKGKSIGLIVLLSREKLRDEFLAKSMLRIFSERISLELQKKQINQALKDTQELLRTVADYTYDWEYWLDPSGNFQYMSPSCQRVTGYTIEDFKSHPELLNEIVLPDDKELWMNHSFKNEEGKYHEFDYRIICSDGSIKWIGHLCYPLYDQNNIYRGRRVSNRDITERKNAETKLKESEAKFRALFENMTEGVFYQSESGKLIDINNSALELMGLSREEFLKRNSDDIEWKIIDTKGVYQTPEKFPSNIAFKTGRKVLGTELGVFNPKTKFYNTFIINAIPLFNTGSDSPNQVFVTMHDISERIEAEKALRQSEERWLFALEGAGDGVWDWNYQSNEVFYSARWKEMLGYSEHEITSNIEEWKSRLHPNDYLEVLQRWLSYLDGNDKVYLSEHRMLCKDGSYKWVLDRGKIVSYTPDGKPLRIIGTHTDIDERKKVEQRLRNSEEQYRLLADNSIDTIWTMQMDGRFTYHSPAIYNLRGYTPEEADNLPFEKTFPPDSLKFIYELMEHENSKPVDKRWLEQKFEIEMYKKDGSIIWTEVSLKAIRNASGEIIGLQGSTQDISERKKTQLQLKESEEKYRELFEANQDSIAIFYVDDETGPGNFIKFNSATSRLTGYSENELYGLSILDFEKDYCPEDLDRRRVQLISSGSMVFDTKIKRKNGSILFVNVRASLIKYGDRTAVMNIVRDITERVIAENELKDSEERFRNIVTMSPDAIAVTRMDDGVYVDVNDSFSQISGYSRDELINKSSITLGIWVDESERIRLIEQIKNLGQADNCNYKFRRKDGKIIYGLMSARYVKLKGVKYLLTITKDFTQIKIAEQKLKESEQRFRTVTETATEAIITTDSNGIIISWNKSAGKLFGYTPDYAVGRNLDFILPKQYRAGRQVFSNDLGNDLHKSIVGRTIEISVLNRDKAEFPIELSLSRWEIENDNYYTAIIRDISDRKRNEKITLLQRDLNLELMSETDLDGAINIISNYAQLFEGVDCGCLFLADKNESLILKKSFGMLKKISAKMSTIGKLNPIYNFVSNTEPVYINCSGTIGKDFLDTLDKKIKSVSLIPILKENKIFSVLCLGSHRNEEFSTEIKNIFESFAFQAGTYLRRIVSEIELKDSEIKYKKFFEADLTGDYQTDKKGEIIDCNEAFLKLFEFKSKDQALSTNITILYSDKSDRKRMFERLNKEKQIHLLELNMRTIGAKEIVVLENTLGIFDEKGYLIGNMGYLFDITKMRIAEIALKFSEKRYRDLFLRMQDGFALHEIILNKKGKPKDYRFIAVNPMFEKLTGLKAHQIVGKTVLEILPKTEKYWIENYGKVALTGEPLRLENFSVEIGKYYRVLAYSPAKFQFATLIEDITKAKVNEEKILQLSTAVEQSPVSVVITDLNGNIKYVNKKFVDLTGYSVKESVGNNPRILNSGMVSKDYYKNMYDTLKAGREWNGTFINKKKNGEIFWEAANISVIVDPDGKPTNYLAIKEDITERVIIENELAKHRNQLEELVKSRTKELDETNRKLQQEIENSKEYEIMLRQALEKEKELSELKSKFISTTSHEFRTPLTSVLSSAELIQRYGRKWNDEKFNYHFSKIKNSIDYLTKLLDDVLTISRSESGKIVFDPSNTNLYDLLLNIIEETLPNKSELHVFQFKYAPKEKEFLIDQKLIRFMVGNLLTNAFKYSPDGGEVILKVSVSARELKINVTDQGIGIPAADMPHLASPFHRAENTTKMRGTGLGLSIVKRSVNLHGGELKISSTEGEGSSFTIILPRN